MTSNNYLCCVPDYLHPIFLDWLETSKTDPDVYHLAYRLEARWEETPVTVKDLLGLMSNCCCPLPG